MLQVKKRSTLKAYLRTLLKARIASLKANQAASKHRKRKKKQIQKRGTLSQAEAENIVRQRDIKAQLEAERRQERVRTGSSAGGIRRCKNCSEAGHNKRTCKKDAAEVEN